MGSPRTNRKTLGAISSRIFGLMVVCVCMCFVETLDSGFFECFVGCFDSYIKLCDVLLSREVFGDESKSSILLFIPITRSSCCPSRTLLGHMYHTNRINIAPERSSNPLSACQGHHISSELICQLWSTYSDLYDRTRKSAEFQRQLSCWTHCDFVVTFPNLVICTRSRNM